MRQPAFLLCVFALLAAATAQRRTPARPHNSAFCGPLKDQIFNCPKFGFSYKVLFGWVERTQEMQDSGAGHDATANERAEGPDPPNDLQGSAPRRGSTKSSLPQQSSSGKSEILLAVFERPPQAKGQTINSAVVVAAEPKANYPGLKTAADYFGPITDLAEQRGFKVVNEPDFYSIGARRLVRGDFSKPMGNLTMWQSSLVMIEKGYVVSFTFVAGSEDEVDELVRNLSFGVSAQQKQVPHR